MYICNMKKGDTLICKKDIVFNTDEIYFKKNETYTIRTIDNKDNSVYINNNSGGLWFYYYDNRQYSMNYYIFDYFYTKEEIRQIKLQSI